MREIKFRGKRLDNGEWVYGHIWAMTDKKVLIMVLTGPNQFEGIKVDPATVGQFTGLCDKNGKEIYEGNIVELGTGQRYTVEYWDEGWAAYVLTYDKHYFEACLADYGDFEVIGNIHDAGGFVDGQL